MNRDNNKTGTGLALTALLLLLVSMLSIFYFKNCIFGIIFAIISAILSTAAFIEARRALAPVAISLIVLLLTWMGAIFSIYWTVAGYNSREEKGAQIEAVSPAEGVEEIDKSERLKALEEKIEQLEKDSLK